MYMYLSFSLPFPLSPFSNLSPFSPLSASLSFSLSFSLFSPSFLPPFLPPSFPPFLPLSLPFSLSPSLPPSLCFSFYLFSSWDSFITTVQSWQVPITRGSSGNSVYSIIWTIYCNGKEHNTGLSVGCGLSGFWRYCFFKISHFGPWTIVHVGQKIESAQKI